MSELALLSPLTLSPLLSFDYLAHEFPSVVYALEKRNAIVCGSQYESMNFVIVLCENSYEFQACCHIKQPLFLALAVLEKPMVVAFVATSYISAMFFAGAPIGAGCHTTITSFPMPLYKSQLFCLQRFNP